MNTKKGNAVVYIIIILIIIIVLGVLVMGRSKNDDPSISQHNNSMAGEETSMEDSSSEMSDGGGSYEDYSPEKINRDGKILLFFHANWCTTCRIQESSILKNKSNIPSDLTILKADYDKEVELKKKYGVQIQHTFVQVDREGNMISKWSGGVSLNDVLKNVK